MTTNKQKTYENDFKYYRSWFIFSYIFSIIISVLFTISLSISVSVCHFSLLLSIFKVSVPVSVFPFSFSLPSFPSLFILLFFSFKFFLLSFFSCPLKKTMIILMLSSLGKIFSRYWNIFLFFPENRFWHHFMQNGDNLHEFVCVEVLRPSQPNRVMTSVVSLPNHTCTGQA